MKPIIFTELIKPKENKEDHKMKTTIKNEEIKVIVEVTLTQFRNQKPYFSITGEVYLANKPAIERNLIRCGCCHDDIQAITNEFDDIISLHLSDIDGLPLHPLENGFYHYAEGIKEDGTPAYLKDEAALKAFEYQRKQGYYKEFLKRTGLQDNAFTQESFDVLYREYHSSDDQNPRNYYKSLISSIRREDKNRTPLIVARNNKALASHLRISLEEAEAIPSGLTKQQFNERYILPNVDRWKQEANAVITKYNLNITKER